MEPQIEQNQTLAPLKIVPKINVTITLTVQSKKLFEATNPTKQVIESFCSLSDNNNGAINPPGTSLANFTSYVFLNKDVSWDAKVKDAEDKDYSVEIQNYIWDSNTQPNTSFFNEHVITRSNNQVKDEVENNENLRGKENIYLLILSITFKNETKVFKIDPKLKINPKYLFITRDDEVSVVDEVDIDLTNASSN